MEKVKSYIYFSENEVYDEADFNNAVSIAKAFSEEIILFGKISKELERNKHFKNSLLKTYIQSNKENKLEVLDSLDLERNIIIIVMKSVDEINDYVNTRAKNSGNKLILNWSIISSKSMRFSILENQHSISEHIPTDTASWTRSLISKYSREYILDSLEKTENNASILIGEVILDEYIYCEPLGKVSKEPIIAFLKQESIIQLGGVLAIAKHISGLGSRTFLISESDQTHRDSIEKSLSFYSDIEYEFLRIDKNIIKTRYVDRLSKNRVFETYQMERKITSAFADFLELQINEIKEKYSNIIVMDYGHSLMTKRIIEFLLGCGLPLSVNTQSNAGNFGINSIRKYIGASKVFLNGSELNKENFLFRDSLNQQIEDLSKLINCDESYVTNGSNGIVSWTKYSGVEVSPAFAPIILDRVGAGDAALAAISTLRNSSVEVDISLFYGNIAGAMLVSSLGNQVSISKDRLLFEANRIFRTLGTY